MTCLKGKKWGEVFDWAITKGNPLFILGVSGRVEQFDIKDKAKIMLMFFMLGGENVFTDEKEAEKELERRKG